MNNIFTINSSSSSNDEITSSDSDSESDLEVEENIYQSENFLNQTKITDYEKNRNKYFTKNLIYKKVMIDTYNQNYLNTSNYKYTFSDEIKNIIGVKLIKSSIKTPIYNVNSTNNIIPIKFNVLGVDIYYTITIMIFKE